MHTPTVHFPNAPISEWSAIRTGSAQGLFAYRHVQAMNLLKLPDYNGGDLTSDQRREALVMAVNFQKPLAALSFFLGVVALEDFVRDFGARLADHPLISALFPELIRLRTKSIPRAPIESFRRLDNTPFGVIDPEDINSLFRSAFGIDPIPQQDHPRLRDLALIRHTVAHHAAVIRQVDLPRFQYYIMIANQLINPPVEFVNETLRYLYNIGRSIEISVRQKIFDTLIATLSRDWYINPPNQLAELIEFFDYFGFLETTNVPVGYAEPGTELYARMQQESQRIKTVLLNRCIVELQNHYSS